MLLRYLVEESVDDTFHKDFLLTYRTFLKDPMLLTDKLKEAWQTGLPDQRERVKVIDASVRVRDLTVVCMQIVKIVLNWVSEHFPDFEEDDRMTKFLDWFEERLIEDVSYYFFM